MNENFRDEIIIASFERTIRRLWILCIILIFALIASNAAWIYYESQFEDVVTTTEATQDIDAGEGGNAIINDGVHVNDESETNCKENH